MLTESDLQAIENTNRDPTCHRPVIDALCATIRELQRRLMEVNFKTNDADWQSALDVNTAGR